MATTGFWPVRGRLKEVIDYANNPDIDLLEYVTPKSAMAIDNTPVCYIPKQITVSEEIGGTIYDVTGVFTGEVDKSLFQQLKELILSEQLV